MSVTAPLRSPSRWIQRYGKALHKSAYRLAIAQNSGRYLSFNNGREMLATGRAGAGSGNRSPSLCCNPEEVQGPKPYCDKCRQTAQKPAATSGAEDVMVP